MNLSQFIDLTLKPEGHAVAIRAEDIVAVVDGADGVLVFLASTTIFKVMEPLTEVAAKMKKAE